MAWIETTKVITVDDWGPKNNSAYDDCYAKATVTLRTEGDKVYFDFLMTTSVNGKTDNKPGVALYFSIDDQEQPELNKYWVYSKTSASWNGFPTRNGSTYSSSITLKDPMATSIPVILKICTTQNPYTYDDKLWTDDNNKYSRTPVVDTTIDRIYYTNIGTGQLDIVDNYNNTFNIIGTKGTDGVNNPATDYTLSWGYSTNYNNTVAKNTNLLSNKLTIISPNEDTRLVYAKNKTDATYGPSTEKYAGATIRQYVAPTEPGIPQLSYSKSRLTIKEPWTFEWDAAGISNYSSPVCGYRIWLFKNGESIPIYNSKGQIISNSSGTAPNKYFYDFDRPEECKFVIDPALHGFQPSDKVKLNILAYTRYGENNNGAQLFSTTQKMSEEATVQNAGTVRVKVGQAWREGQVHVKVNGTWKEADLVYTKVAGSWKEAE